MIALIIVIALIVTILLLGRKGKKMMQNEQRAAEAVNPDEFDYRNSFNIAGINKHGASFQDCGTWKGWVARDAQNRYDKNAVAVFKGTEHIGYLNKTIAAKYAGQIESLDGQVPAVVQIEKQVDEEDGRKYLVGRVQILWPDTE